MPTKREEQPIPIEPAIVKAMRQWSDEKLDLELLFAEAGLVETWPETVAWLAAIRAEVERRKSHDGEAKAA